MNLKTKAGLREKLAILYRDSHTYPELKANRWPDDFAKEAIDLVIEHIEGQLPPRDEKEDLLHTNYGKEAEGFNQCLSEVRAILTKMKGE